MKDIKWHINEAAKMWIKWTAAEHQGNGLIKLKGCTFYGPVLSDLVKIEDNETMSLDFTHHFIVLVPKPYLVKFRWDRVVEQNPSKAMIEGAELLDQELGCLKIAKDSDRMLVDFTGHRLEDQQRGFIKPHFEAMLYNAQNMPYSFY